MRKLGITQRVDFIESYKERRDCLDQRWSLLSLALGFIPIPLPNCPGLAEKLITSLSLDAIVLSNGNSLCSVETNSDDCAPERDSFEKELIEHSIKRKLPILGICRGMQMLNVYFGGSLSRIFNQAGMRHSLTLSSYINANNEKIIYDSVNSYHNWGIKLNDLAIDLKDFAWDNEGNIEGYLHSTEKIMGIMWHPEREEPFNSNDIYLLKQFLLCQN